MLSSVFSIIARLFCVCILTGLPGYFALRFFSRKSQEFSLISWLFLVTALGLVLVGLNGVVMAMAGCFTPFAIVAGVCVISFLLYIFGGADKDLLVVPRITRWDILALVLVVIAWTIFFPPHENFIVGRDPGVYTNTAIHLARTGRWVMEDPFFVALPATAQEAFLSSVWGKGSFRLPGFFWEPERGMVLSQFLPFFTVWMALFEKLVGPGCGPWATPVFMALAALGLVDFAMRFWRPIASVLFLFMFLFHPAVIWYARSANSEVALLVILLLLMVLWTECWAHEKGWRIPILLSAVLLAGFLDKLDMIYFGVFFLLVIAGTQVFFPESRANARLGLALLVAVVLASGCLGFLSMPYLKLSFEYLVLNVLLRYFLVLLTLSLMAFLALYFWGGRFPPLLRAREWIATFQGLSPKQIRLLAAMLLCLFVLAYWVLPQTVPDDLVYDRRLSLAKLGWYLTPVGFLLAGIGGLSLFAKREFSKEALLFTGFFGVSLVLNLVAPTTDHIFAIRRFMAFSFPALLLLAAAGLVYVGRWRPRGVSWAGIPLSLLLGCAMLLAQFPHSQLIAAHQEYAGAREMLQRLGERIDPGTVAVFYESDSFLGTFAGPNLWLEHDVASLYAFRPLSLADWQSVRQLAGVQNRGVIAVGSRPPQILPDTNRIALQRFSWHLPELERVYDHFPNQINSFDFEFTIWQIIAGKGATVYQPEALLTQVGALATVAGQEVLLGQGQSGYLSYGPYHGFPSGHYTVRYTLLNSHSTECRVSLDVVPWDRPSLSESLALAKPGETVSWDVPFTVADDVAMVPLEFRVFLPDGGAVGLVNLVIFSQND